MNDEFEHEGLKEIRDHENCKEDDEFRADELRDDEKSYTYDMSR